MTLREFNPNFTTAVASYADDANLTVTSVEVLTPWQQQFRIYPNMNVFVSIRERSGTNSIPLAYYMPEGLLWIALEQPL